MGNIHSGSTFCFNYFVPLQPIMWVIAIVFCYFILLFSISQWTGRQATNATFYRANRQSPWYMVAFGMIGASISGVTFISVPGMVLHSQMTYLQTCMGFVLGYVIVAFVLLPIYYRLNLISIYAYLGQRLGRRTHKTASSFFLLSKMVGAAIKFYAVCIILQRFVFESLGVPFVITVIGLVLLIWLYTRRGGIKTLVWTDALQTMCLFSALFLIIYKVVTDLGLDANEALMIVKESELSRVFVFDDWVSKQNFWKQFLSGVFIVIVMTGLDQDMMQKNLTCKTLHGAQKDMCSYGLAFLPANALFLALGVLLTLWYQQQGQMFPSVGDELLPRFVTYVSSFSPLITIVFVLGIVAASFSSADSALASLTTICCVDLLEIEENSDTQSGRSDAERIRKQVHLLMCVVFMLFVVLFDAVNSKSLIDAVYTIVSYTYGPLLGLFAFGLLTKRQVYDRLVPYIAVASPVICYVLDWLMGMVTGYHFGYELLMLNGLLVFLGLVLCTKK